AVERVDADVEDGTRGLGLEPADELSREPAGRGFARLAHGILKIEDERIGATGRPLGELLFIVGGNEQKRAHGLRPLSAVGAPRAGAGTRPPARPSDCSPCAGAPARRRRAATGSPACSSPRS